MTIHSLGLGCDKHYLNTSVFSERIEEYRQEWTKLQKNYLKPWGDSEFEHKLFINPAHYEKIKKEMGAEFDALRIYPNLLKQYHSHQRAQNFLNEMPNESFQLTTNLIQKIHQMVMKDVYRFDEKVLSKLPLANWIVQAPGVFKKLFNFGFSPLTKQPLTETQYQAIVDNPLLKFWELPKPLSRKGARKGLIVFPRKAQKRLEDLVKWFHHHKNIYDPVYLAATFQRKFISIHPFYNGNGRVSRLIMNKILNSYGLPPSIPKDYNQDIYLNKSALVHDELEWAEFVLDGIGNAIEKHPHNSKYDPITDIGGWADESTKFDDWGELPEPPSTPDDPIFDDPSMPDEPWIDPFDGSAHNGNSLVNHRIYHGRLVRLAQKEFFFDSEKFFLREDGFFYNKLDIPHVEYEGTLYPISDMSYFLYDRIPYMNVKKHEFLEKQRALISREHEKIVLRHLKIANKIHFGHEVNLKVDTDYKFDAANRSLDYHFYPWQKDLVKDALTLSRAEEIASMNFKAKDSEWFQMHDHIWGNGDDNGSYQESANLIAEYQINYLEGLRLDKAVKKYFPELRELSHNFQEKVFRSFKKELNKHWDEVKPIKGFVERDDVEILKEYYNFTPLRYNSFDSAKVALGDHIYLLRSDSAINSKVGFFTDEILRKVYDRTPYVHEIIDYLRKRSKNVDVYLKNNKNIFKYKRSEITVKPELKREAILLGDHASNANNSHFNSFSSLTSLYSWTAFRRSGAKGLYKLFLTKLNINDVFVNRFGLSGEYEFLVRKYISPFKINKSLKEFEYKDDGFGDPIEPGLPIPGEPDWPSDPFDPDEPFDPWPGDDGPIIWDED